MTAGWNASALWAMGATTGREMRAYDNLLWQAASYTGVGTLGGLTSWGPSECVGLGWSVVFAGAAALNFHRCLTHIHPTPPPPSLEAINIIRE